MSITQTEIVSVGSNARGKVVARTTATVNDEPVTLVGIQFANGVKFYMDSEITECVYSASVEVDYDAAETVEEAAESLIDFIRSDYEGPIYVHVRVDGETHPSHTVEITYNADGKPVGKVHG